MYLWKFMLANINITRICIMTLSILTERIPWLDIIHFLLWNEWFFYFHFNCQCQISWNHDFWLSFIQSLSVISSSVISSSVTLHLWSLHLWLFICDLFICDSSSVISSSVTLHLCLYLSFMARYITLKT
jgi:hypothetical protein